ncbi:hypothetical protein B0H63DRAFT_477286 [Podospora didyma]|uniref:Uncharacterized protein n=1 Tax=Podospora didyma TaxID=330526 RepID=A0AAE0NBR2_9PEZI|nr:hypothetical protein B0H63DRAFT_477286 [Podospora didyma]
MRLHGLLTTLSFLLLAGTSSATHPKAPKAPGLEYLYNANITAGEIVVVGQVPRGLRAVAAITGGQFAGPKFKGTILPLGGDWELIDANGTITIDVRQTFKTDDGAVIQIFETGSTQTDGTGHVRLTFETGSKKYYWINSIVGIAIIRGLGPNTLTIDAWQMTAP